MFNQQKFVVFVSYEQVIARLCNFWIIFVIMICKHENRIAELFLTASHTQSTAIVLFKIKHSIFTDKIQYKYHTIIGVSLEIFYM